VQHPGLHLQQPQLLEFWEPAALYISTTDSPGPPPVLPFVAVDGLGAEGLEIFVHGQLPMLLIVERNADNAKDAERDPQQGQERCGACWKRNSCNAILKLVQTIARFANHTPNVHYICIMFSIENPTAPDQHPSERRRAAKHLP